MIKADCLNGYNNLKKLSEMSNFKKTLQANSFFHILIIFLYSAWIYNWKQKCTIFGSSSSANYEWPKMVQFVFEISVNIFESVFLNVVLSMRKIVHTWSYSIKICRFWRKFLKLYRNFENMRIVVAATIKSVKL